jgi:hypothetical protein
MTSKTLLDFSDSDSTSEQSNDNHLRINKTFADDYEKRKRRQELVNAQQNDEDTSDYESSSDESEDEDAALLTSKMDLQILKVGRTISALEIYVVFCALHVSLIACVCFVFFYN